MTYAPIDEQRNGSPGCHQYPLAEAGTQNHFYCIDLIEYISIFEVLPELPATGNRQHNPELKTEPMPRSRVRHSLYAPFQLMRKWRERAAMLRHRDAAILAPGARVLVDGWIVNPGEKENIRVGRNTIIRGELLVFPHGGHISIGDWCFVGHESFLWSAEKIIIGDRCLISHHVNIHDTNSHADDPALRHAQFAAIATHGQPQQVQDIPSSPITIADDVWIGFNATILKGVSIGKGAIVGAGAVVTKDVESWTVVAGSPARVIRRLSPDNWIPPATINTAPFQGNF